MVDEIITARRGRSWQFSLKSLMFLMFVVAISAGIISISPPLAVIVVPYIVAAAARTALFQTRVVPDEQLPGKTPGFLATFVQSLLLLVALTLMCLATVAAVGTAAALIAATWAVRALAAIAAVLRARGPQAQQLARGLWRGLRVMLQQIRPYDILNWVRSRAVVVTATLFFASRRLLRQCWCAEGAAHSTRTEPL